MLFFHVNMLVLARTSKSTGRKKILFYCVHAKLVRENKKKKRHVILLMHFMKLILVLVLLLVLIMKTITVNSAIECLIISVTQTSRNNSSCRASCSQEKISSGS